MSPRARSAKQRKERSRRRARWTMRGLTVVCALAALGVGATQLVANGLGTFFDRPPGVGANRDTAAQPTRAKQNAPAPKAAPNPQALPPVPEPPVDPYDQPVDPYDQPPVDTYDQPPVDTYDQSPLDTYDPPPFDTYGQQPPDGPRSDPYGPIRSGRG